MTRFAIPEGVGDRRAIFVSLASAAAVLVLRLTPVFDPDYFWRPMATCPLGVKVQLLGQGGVAIYGSHNGKDPFWTGWAPLPKKPPPPMALTC